MSDQRDVEWFETIVIGGGQAGLATGYHLRRQGIQSVILDAGDRVGDAWRQRWDSLRAFTPARYDGLPGLPFPGERLRFPTKDEVADYLEGYARHFDLPVRNGVRVDRVRVARGGRPGFLVTAGDRSFEAAQVVVASGAFLDPRVPGMAKDLDPAILQLHSSEYRRPAQLRDGPVLVVGAANSGAEIAHDIALAGGRRTWLVGRDTGHLPFDTEGRVGRWLDPVIWFGANHLLTIGNPIGRKAVPSFRFHGQPLERVKPANLAAAGVVRVVARMEGAREGLPVLDDGTVLDVANVVWCTGFGRDYGWLEPATVDADGWPIQELGVVATAPGLYFIGLPFQRSAASALIGGVGRDAAYVAERIARHTAAAGSRADARPMPAGTAG